MKTRRDALVLVFLGFFAVVVGYLFDDGFLAALYSLLPVTALLAALIGLQQSAFASRPWPTLRLAGGLLPQALPLMPCCSCSSAWGRCGRCRCPATRGHWTLGEHGARGYRRV